MNRRRHLVLFTAGVLCLGSVQAAGLSPVTGPQPKLAAWPSSSAESLRESYRYTSLSEVIGSYWRTLDALGYRGSVTRTSVAGSTYLFSVAEGSLEAVFTLSGDRMTVTLLRLPRETRA